MSGDGVPAVVNGSFRLYYSSRLSDCAVGLGTVPSALTSEMNFPLEQRQRRVFFRRQQLPQTLMAESRVKGTG